MSPQNDYLLTPKEAAEYLKVSESYLAKARMRGTGPAFIQLGRAVRYSRTALENHKAAQTRTSTLQRRLPLRAHIAKSDPRSGE